MPAPISLYDPHCRGVYSAAAASVNLGSGASSGVFSSLRWAPPSTAFLVLLRLRLAWYVVSQVTTAVPMAWSASVVRNFTTDFTTNTTAVDLTTPVNSGKRWRGQAPSLLGAVGPREVTNGAPAAMTGGVYTTDSNFFGLTLWTVSSVTGSSVTMPVGVGGEMLPLFEWRGGESDFPIILAPREGIIVQTYECFWQSGTVNTLINWEWAEFDAIPGIAP